MTDSEKKLRALRNEIDGVDDKLLALISQRARLAQQIAAVKDGDGKDAQGGKVPISGAHPDKMVFP